MATRTLPHLAHWGAFGVEVAGEGDDARVVAVHGHADDPAPSPLHANVVGDGLTRGRVARPAVRRGWLEGGPGPDDRRGSDHYVEVGWDETLDLAAGELRRVRAEHGNAAIFGGSYGWASAGRFHHAQSQLHRFLNAVGGSTRSVGSYSLGASEVLIPHVLGGWEEARYRATTWPEILEHTELVVAFGGMNPKNAWVTPGGVTRHTLLPSLAEAGRRGLRFELVSPLRDDLPADVDVQNASISSSPRQTARALTTSRRA
jgi:biotin/methionine sulfoxide reductase